MEILDLTRHDPEEYEGKVVNWRECQYLVGACLGSGAERITHKLINCASGLCLHVLKVWRQPDLGYVPSQIRATLAAGRTPEFDFAKIIPISIEIELPGGLAEMQIYAGGAGDSTTPADTLTKRGDELLESGTIPEAIPAYAQALAENPNHTHALVNLAAAYAQTNNPAKAYHAAAQARNIEPNYPLYHRACIQYLATQGLGRLALDDFHAARECFPNVLDFDDIGAQLLLVCGYPEEALKCAEGCLLDPAEKATLLEKVHAAVNAQTTARPLIDKARSLVNLAKPQGVADLLTRAREIDPNDPLLAMNLGLTLAREGRSADSIPLLLHAANYGPPEWKKTCYANAAFCAMDEGKLDLAMILLDLTMALFDVELQGRQLQNLAADLPGRGIWVDDQSIMEERIDAAARLVVRSLAEHKKHAIVPENALRLATLYGEVADQ
jgi:tetratricopeptide (TPR) repeat protein